MDSFSSGLALACRNPLQFCAVLCAFGLLAHKVTQHHVNCRRNPARLPFPPGPKGYPFIGSIFDMPTSEQWRVYADWAKIYGDVLSFEVLGQRIAVLNSLEAAQDLLEKRSANYSDRPKMKMLFGLMGCDYNFGLMPYGSWWRRHRRTFSEHFNEGVVWKYLPLQAKGTRAFLNRLLLSPERFVDHIRELLKDGTAGPSLAADLIAALPEGDDAMLVEATQVAQNVAAITYGGGADTSISALQSFMLVMAMYPEVQKKAQTELDAVIGHHRLPEFSDRPSLHYVNATVKEMMRWSLVVPLAMPHIATEDDVYRGYFIPKGTMIFGNAWAMLNDEKVFENPGEFRPERYLKNGKLDPTVRQPDVAFGFGRRVCPGRFLSDNTLFSIVSSTLHTFSITPALDEKGVPVPLSNQTSSGIIVHPQPFKVDIKPRSVEAEALIKDGILGDI